MSMRYIHFLFMIFLIHAMPSASMSRDHEDSSKEQAENDDERLLQAALDNGKPPAVPTRFYQYFWGHYPEMRKKGVLPFIDDAVATYGKNGEPVRVSLGMKDLFVISDPKDAHLILYDSDNFAKGFSSQFLRDYFVGEGIGFLEKSEGWREMHDAMFRFFNETAVRTRYFETMQQHVFDLVKRLKSRAGSVINLEKEMTIFTIKIISHTMLNFDVTDDVLAMELARSFETALKFIHYRMTNFPFYLPLFLPTEENNNYKQAAKVIDSFLQAAIDHDEDLSERGQEPDSIISYLRKASKSPQPIKPESSDSPTIQISQARFLGQLKNILMAGHDTTKHLLTSIFYQLMQNPQVQKKLRTEFYEAGLKSVGIKDALQLSKRNLPYLDAVVQEALRINSPVPGVARDVLHDVVLRGYTIPKGSIVMISFDLLHRNKTQWSDPYTFNPDRFFEDACSDSGEPIKRDYNSLMPFSSGPRACAGKFFAMLEVKTTVAEMLLAGIDFEPVDDTDFTQIMACTRRLKNGLKVRVRCQKK